MYFANLRYHILSISFSYSFLLHNLQIHRYGVDRITRLISNSVIGESVCSTCMHAKLGWSRSAITGRVCLLLENARLILTVDKLSWYHIIRKRWIFFRMFLFFFSPSTWKFTGKLVIIGETRLILINNDFSFPLFLPSERG